MSGNHLIQGDALSPESSDMIAQTEYCVTGGKPKGYDGRNCGWRVMSGNEHGNTWARVAYRYEIEASA